MITSGHRTDLINVLAARVVVTCVALSLLVALALSPACAIRTMTVDEIISYAAGGVGSPYVWGGGCWSTSNRSWGGADCSGYVAKCWQVPRDSAITENYHPYNTSDFRSYNYYWSNIGRGSTVRGDAMVYHSGGSGHIFLFEAGDPWGSMLTYEARCTTCGIVHNWRTASSSYVTRRRYQIGVPTPTWAAAYHAQSFPATMTAGTTATAWAEYTNTGTATWGHAATNLGTQGPQDRSSPFYNAGNWISASRPSNVDQSAVTTGQVGRFTFILKAPTTPGTYVEQYKPVQEGVTWFGDTVTWTITVTASTGNITGTVRNVANGLAISGATVAITGGGSTTTNGSGVYTFTGLSAATYTLNVSMAGYTSTSGTATLTAGATTTKDFNLVSSDSTPPTVPSGLTATSISPSQINLSWTGSTDSGGAGLAGYIIYRGGAEVGRTASTTYSDNGLAQNTTYSYYVKAYDNANNVSGQSNTASAATTPGTVPIFEDGFANTSYWQALQQSPMTSPNGLVLDATYNHGTFTGANSFMAVDTGVSTQGTLSGHTFSPAFAAAKFDTWFYDTSINNNSRQGLEVRCLDGAGGIKAIYYVGTYSTAPGSFSTYSVGYYKACGSGCTGWYWQGQVKTRVIGWHKFTIDFQPYTGALNEVTFYIDDVKMGNSVERTLDTQTYGLNMVSFGYHYRVNVPGWFDDVAMYASAPNPPTMGTPVALSTTSIRWVLTDNSNNEMGFRILDAAQAVKASAALSNSTGAAVNMDEAGLTPNAPYTRYAKAFNGTLNSLTSAAGNRWTLSIAPTASNVTCDKPTDWLSTTAFTFTAVGGFGQGTVAKYLYAWDTNPTHTWTGSEAVWNSGVLILTAPTTGSYYLHIKGYNGENVENGVLDLGSFKYDNTPPTAPVVADDGAYTGSTTQLHASWSGADDPESGVAKYWYAIGTTSGGTNVVDWTQTTDTSVTKTGLSLSQSQTYYFVVKAENGVGLQSGVGTSDGITVAQVVGSIATAKALPDGTAVTLNGNIVTANFGTQFYMEDARRISGMLVDTTSPDEGREVSVTGLMATMGAERMISDPIVVLGGNPGVPAPLFMVNRGLGGCDLNQYTFGITGGSGANTVGLLVTTVGKVTYVDDDSEFCYVDDGACLNDTSGYIGVKVDTTVLSTTVLATGQYVRVTGISTIDIGNLGNLVRLIRPRRDADIVIYP